MAKKLNWKLLCLCMGAFLCVQIVIVVGIVQEQYAEHGGGGVGAVETTAKQEEPSLPLYAKSAVLMDAKNGRVLYGKNEHDVMPMASTTKIMTCIVALEYGFLQDEVTFSKYAASMPKVHLGASVGTTYTLEALLYSLMLESHNDSAAAIAEYVAARVVGGDRSAETVKNRDKEESKKLVGKFADLMNQKAKELGCEHTMFLTPNGLDATMIMEDGEVFVHSTTAKELAQIMAYCVLESEQKEQFLKITQTSSKIIADQQGLHQKSLNNHNAFLSMDTGAISGKTGFTAKAGYCYVGAVKEGDAVYVASLLACGWPNNKTYKWKDMRCLMEYGRETFQWVTFEDIAQSYCSHFYVEVEDGAAKDLKERPMIQVEIEQRSGEMHEAKERQVEGLLLRENQQVKVTEQWESPIEAPVKIGEVVGTRIYCIDGEIVKTQDIIACQSIEKIDFLWCLKQIAKKLV